jgi:hypothetical protein
MLVEGPSTVYVVAVGWAMSPRRDPSNEGSCCCSFIRSANREGLTGVAGFAGEGVAAGSRRSDVLDIAGSVDCAVGGTVGN